MNKIKSKIKKLFKGKAVMDSIQVIIIMITIWLANLSTHHQVLTAVIDNGCNTIAAFEVKEVKRIDTYKIKNL